MSLFDYLRRALAGFVSREKESIGRECPVALILQTWIIQLLNC